MGVLQGSDCYSVNCLGQSFVYWNDSKEISVFAEKGLNYFVVVSLPRHSTDPGSFVLRAEVS